MVKGSSFAARSYDEVLCVGDARVDFETKLLDLACAAD
jgi:hypothetical protein